MDLTQIQTELKGLLQDEPQATRLENLAAALIGRLLGVTIAVAKSGFQHGGDAGPAGRQGRRLRIECKKYSDTTALSDRELLGEMDQALARDPALEAWILVATRNVSEQLEQSLNQHGELIGVPVIILDWKPQGLPSLAGLCAFAPDLVSTAFSAQAGALAQQLNASSGEAVESLRRDLQAWCLGFESLRSQSIDMLDKIWRLPRTSAAALGQNAASGAVSHKVRRRTVHDALDAWWDGPARDDAPVTVVGWDGVGKTWATVDWLVEKQGVLPIVLVVPSSAVAQVNTTSEMGVKSFLADRLFELAAVRNREHWLRRLDNLLKRPKSEGPVITVFFDGLNQEPSAPWLQMLKTLQGDNFEHRIRVIVSTRTLHYETKLGYLRGLIVPASLVSVDLYDKNAGGELDQMLAFEGLTQGDLHPDLVELARTPRLFWLVVKFRERLVEAGQVTIHRLLWEYGRDSFGSRAGRSFSEGEWREWLQEVARQYRDGVREFSLKTLGETASRADLSEREAYARLSDIIDGRFAIPGPSGSLQLQPTIVDHALGAALLAQFGAIASPTFDAINAELTQWLDPIAGLDQRAEILRAAVSIAVERGESTSPVAGALVTAWLQTQNVTDAHRLELAGLADSLCVALLDAVEHSAVRTHTSARLWAVNALRSIQRSNHLALAEIVARARQWLAVVSRDVRPPERTNADQGKARSEHFLKRVGVDASGALQVLGLDLQFVDVDNGILGSIVPLILVGFPLTAAAPAFEAAAIAVAVRFHNQDVWDGLKWLCLLNEIDAPETTASLRALSASVLNRTPEASVNPLLPARVAALLLWLTGEETDETTAVAIDSGLDRHFTYEQDYLPQPSRSYFTLERRHAEAALNDIELPLLVRIQRTRDLWLDPNFVPPPSFVKEVRDFVAHIEIEKLNGHHSKTIEDHHFEELEPTLARCAPDLLSDLMRRKVQSFGSCPPESRYWNAIHATDHLLLAGEAERAAAQVLRLSARETTDSEEVYATSQLLMLELNCQKFSDQADAIIEANLKYILTDLCEILCEPSADETDELIARYGAGSGFQRRDLLSLLSNGGIPFSESTWSWLVDIAFGSDSDLHGLSFFVLARLDASRFGRELFARKWTWSPGADFWVNHYGTGALIEGTGALPFEQIAPHLAPWRLLEAARRRGSDPVEVCWAAKIFGGVLAADHIEVPDPGASLSADRTELESGAFSLTVTTNHMDEDRADPIASLRAFMDVEAQLKELNRATETAAKRIREARASGASLYLADVASEDLELVLIHAPELVEEWLEGSNELTSGFKRRVRLAEAAYLALCEALLKHDANRGVTLWRSLSQALTTRYIGNADVEEMIHIAFRAPDTPPVAEIREELVGLARCHSDKNLLDIAIAAAFNGKADWLAKIIEEDKASSFAWRRKRGTVLESYTSFNELPVEDAWPDGEIKTNYKDFQRRSGRSRYREACARHWWKCYLATPDASQAYASWVLFLRSADRRVRVWFSDEARAANDSAEFFKLKASHAQLNHSKMKRAMEKNEEKLDKEFLGRKIVGGVDPWVK